MKSFDEIKELAIETLKNEAESISKLSHYVDNDFCEIVKRIYESDGRVVITGIGKSAIIAQKIVATLNSTGTPAIFMHAADAIHGDLGNIQESDVVLCISNSGNTPEIKVLVPLIKNFGNLLIGMTGNDDSYLALQSDHVLHTKIDREACPINLAPTSSTIAQMAIGDALSVCLLEYRGFTSKDFAKYHPGGALGKRLYLRVKEIYPNNALPKVQSNASLKDVILEISSKRLGATAVLDNEKLIGVITDGDLRRMLESGGDFDTLTAKEIMTKDPETIDHSELAANALGVMEKKNITQLLVTKDSEYVGVIHLHDLLKEGIL